MPLAECPALVRRTGRDQAKQPGLNGKPCAGLPRLRRTDLQSLPTQQAAFSPQAGAVIAASVTGCPGKSMAARGGLPSHRHGRPGRSVVPLLSCRSRWQLKRLNQWACIQQHSRGCCQKAIGLASQDSGPVSAPAPSCAQGSISSHHGRWATQTPSRCRACRRTELLAWCTARRAAARCTAGCRPPGCRAARSV
eukprot:360129-Chlamydomonas_euryale.AAC.1